MKNPKIEIARAEHDGAISVSVDGVEITNVVGVSVGMGPDGSVATIVLNVDDVQLSAELSRLLLTRLDEDALGEAN